jgi:hypothetical protein
MILALLFYWILSSEKKNGGGGNDMVFKSYFTRLKSNSFTMGGLEKIKNVERCKHVKSQATTVYFSIGRLGRVSTYVQHV